MPEEKERMRAEEAGNTAGRSVKGGWKVDREGGLLWLGQEEEKESRGDGNGGGVADGAAVVRLE